MSERSFADLPATAAEHFKLHFYAAVLHVIGQVSKSLGSPEVVLQQFPFLGGYYDELAARGVDRVTESEARAWWCNALREWERRISGHLPLRALREATALDYTALTLLLTIGLIEEDPRFGLLFEALQITPGQHRPTLGLLNTWWPNSDEGSESRERLRWLQQLGLLQVINPDAPRLQWAFQIPGLLWDVLRGCTYETLAPWARYHKPEHLVSRADLIIAGSLQESLTRIPELLAGTEERTVVVRGPRHNGRRTLLGAIGRELGRGVLEIGGFSKMEDERWKLIGPLATMLHALPVMIFELGPGESAEIPLLTGYDGPLGVVLGSQGGLRGPNAESALTITLDIPDLHERRSHWIAAANQCPVSELESISERFRMTGGNIRRAGKLAQSYAALAGRPEITLCDVQRASHTLNRQVLEPLAVHLPACGDWSRLAAGRETLEELYNLERRCRHRERLRSLVGDSLGAQLNSGVRALLSGPSGTGKSLAARLLASVLQMDLYRLDLSAVVNKYIGETEKNLNEVFARADELDVILLLDEGDALLTQRTNVQTANDRYANLETNYLLQRIESYSGILLVTTNAADRIDGAFQRRMDVVIDFRAPEAEERWYIWQLHLPATHSVPQSLLNEIAYRCTLNGGQIRNAVLHASLLAVDAKRDINGPDLEAAVQREYRKSGAVCPLRRAPNLAVVGG
jgi:hypothetical protein